MSQNKTVIQGLESAEAPSRNGGGIPSSNFYARSSERPARGTVVSGMSPAGMNPNPNANEAPAAAHQPAANIVSSGKPVIGFLYSVSRTAAGEYWPLHVGQNTIGQSPQCNIVLPEGTVSSEHAVLVIRKMKKPEEKVIASISDARSTNGTMLNGESLGFTAVDCKNGDILTFGDNYEMLLILLDAASLGLHVNPNFIPIAVEEDEEFEDAPDPFFDRDKTRPGDASYGGPTPPPFGGGYSPAGGTVGMDGSTFNNKGGTVGM